MLILHSLNVILLGPIFVPDLKYNSIINYIITVLSHIPLAHPALRNFPWFCNGSFLWAFNRAVLTWGRTTLVDNDLEGAPGINEWQPGYSLIILGTLPSMESSCTRKTYSSSLITFQCPASHSWMWTACL